MMKIFRGDDEILSVIVGASSKGKKELMVEDSITLAFSLNNAIRLRVGDYINDERFGLYILNEDYLPVYNEATGGFDYNVRFDAYYYQWNNKLLKYNPQEGSSELSFSITATIEVHLSVIHNNLSNLGFSYNGSLYVANIDSSLLNISKHISYQNIYILDALHLIAETFECEVWIEGNVINLGRCYYENDFVLEIGNTVVTMTPADSSEEYGTRLYVYGAETNLPKNYRDTTGVVNGVVQKHLMLPEGVPYIDSREGLTQDTAVEFVKIFDNIYPRTEGNIFFVTTYEDSIEDESGNTVTEVFYRYKDIGINFSEDYLLPSEELSIKFSSGLLNGMTFGVKFNPLGVSEKNSDGTWNADAQLFEIVVNENYGRRLPDLLLYPQKGDTYVLLNWDSTKIAELGLVEAAENELLEAGIKYLQEIDVDSKVYTCTMMSDIAHSMYTGHITSLLNMGDAIELKNDVYFPEGNRKSRILGIEYKIDYPWDSPIFTVGESPKYSRLKTIETEVDEIIYQGEINKTFGSGSSVYILSRKDKTPPSDRNVFSALRTQQDFLRKNTEDVATSRLTFEKGLEAKDVTTKDVSSPVFVSGFTGEGFKIWLDDLGLTYLEIDKLTVRQIMTVFELVISRIKAVGGEVIISAANGKIKSVEDAGDDYKITFEGDNYFEAHDLLRCQVFTGVTENGVQTPIRGYWVEVRSVSGNSILISKSEFTEWGTEPKEGDECVLMGNTNKTTRQSLISMSATNGQPKIDMLNGVKSKSLAGCLRTRLGNLDGIEDEHFGKGVVKGDGLYSDNAFLKGDFILKSTGKSVDTMFSITEDGVKSVVSTLQNDAERGKTILYNSTFAWGKRGWITSNIVTYYLSNDKPVYNDGKLVYNSVRNDVRDKYDNYRFILNIADGYIKQLNGYFINKPDINVDNLVPVSLGLQARVEEKGYLLAYLDGCTDMPSSKVNAYKGRVRTSYATGSDVTVNIGEKLYTFASISNCAIGYTEEVDADNNTTITYDEIAFIKNSDKTIRLINISQRKEIQYDAVEEVTDVTGEDISTPFVFIACEELAESSEYLPLEYASRWNGTGTFSGGVSIYSLQLYTSLYTSATEARYATLFEQTEKIINIAAQHFNDDGSIAAQSGIMAKPEGTDMYAYNGTTGKYAAIGVAGDDGEGNTVVKLTGDKIKLDGNLTVNGNFKVRDDGSIEARNALFSGFVQQGTMYINDDNYTSFYKDAANGKEITETTTAWKVLITNASPILILEHKNVPLENVYIELPSTDVISAAAGVYTRPELDYARGFIGSTIILYNYTTKNIWITYTDPDGTQTTKSDKLPSGNFIKMTCGLAYKSRNDKTGEYTYWDIDMEGKAIDLPTK